MNASPVVKFIIGERVECGKMLFMLALGGMMLPLRFLREADLFVDIGANVGSCTVLASGVGRATSRAFEPDPGTLRRLNCNISIEDLDRLAKVFELALGDAEGEVAFTVDRDVMKRFVSSGAPNVRTVRRRRLDV